MITTNHEKFTEKLVKNGTAYRAQITTAGDLLFDGSKSVKTSDFFVIRDNQVWGRTGLSWLQTAPLPADPILLCAFSLQRMVVFRGDGIVDCLSPKKPLDSSTSLLICAKLPTTIRLMIADPAAGAKHLTLTFCRDESAEAFCATLIKQFAKQRVPEHADTVAYFLDGGEELE